MSRTRRIHIAVACTSGSFAKRDVPLHGQLIGIAKRNFPIDGVQIVTVTVDASGGTFTVTRNGGESSGIAANATAATVQTALRAVGSGASFGDVVVTRTGVVDAYVYTLTFSDSTSYDVTGLILNGIGSHFTVTTNAASLTGGASTAAVANTGPQAMTATADIHIRDQLSGALIYGDLTFNTGAVEVPSMPITDSVGAAIAAAAGHSIDAPIPLAGLYSVYVSQATTTDVGSLWLIVRE